MSTSPFPLHPPAGPLPPKPLPGPDLNDDFTGAESGRKELRPVSVRVEYVSIDIGGGMPFAADQLADEVNKRLANGGVLHGTPFIVPWEGMCGFLVQTVLHPL